MNKPEEDVKIYQGPEKKESTRTPGEVAAEEFVSHRENGNLDKTRQLGELLAETLVGDARRICEEDCYRQKLVLLSFLAVDELEGKLPNLILQKSAKSAMLARLEDVSPEVYDIVIDSTAFTMYILNDRQRDGDSTGQVLAQLCDRDDDEVLIARGDELEAEYRKLFGGIITSYTFKEI